MGNQKGKRWVSILVTAVMVWNLCVFSPQVQVGAAAGSGLCEHHPQHTQDCGYAESVPEAECAHEHTQACYREVIECVHEHVEGCFPDISGSVVTQGGITKEEPTQCSHICSEESGCITTVPECGHVHDEACGYSEGTAGSPCTYVCEICGESEDSSGAEVPSGTGDSSGVGDSSGAEGSSGTEDPSGTEDSSGTENSEESEILQRTVCSWTWVDLDERLLQDGDAWLLNLSDSGLETPVSEQEIAELLPEEITVVLNEAETASDSNAAGKESLSLGGWYCDEYPEEGAVNGSFLFTANLPEGYVLEDGAETLEVTVQLGGAMMLAASLDHLVRLIYQDPYKMWNLYSLDEAINGTTLTNGTVVPGINEGLGSGQACSLIFLGDEEEFSMYGSTAYAYVLSAPGTVTIESDGGDYGYTLHTLQGLGVTTLTVSNGTVNFKSGYIRNRGVSSDNVALEVTDNANFYMSGGLLYGMGGGLIIDTTGDVELSGGTFQVGVAGSVNASLGIVSGNERYQNVFQLLAPNCCYYDSDGSPIERDESQFYFNQAVSVGPCEEHVYGDWTNTTHGTSSANGIGQHKSTCIYCGHEETQNCSYSYTQNGDTHTVTCTECDGSFEEPHQWGGYTFTDTEHTRICELCGAESTGEEHIWEDYEPVDDKNHESTCVCGAESGEKGHTWGDYEYVNDTTHKRSCTVCGYDITGTHEPGENGCVCGAVVQVGEDQCYRYIRDALIAANGTDTKVTLLDDVSMDDAPQVGSVTLDSGSITLNLNGKTLSLRRGGLIIEDLAELTIEGNGNSSSRLYMDSHNVSIYGGSLQLNGGTYEFDTQSLRGNVFYCQNASITVSNTTISGMITNSYAIQNVFHMGEDSRITVENVNFQYEEYASSAHVKDIYLSSDATATFYGGSFKHLERTGGQSWQEFLGEGKAFYDQSDGSLVTDLSGLELHNVRVDDCNHNYSVTGTDGTSHTLICTVCGNSETESHTYDDALTCTVCGYNNQIISVEVTWGWMWFTYDEGTWDPETHTYQGSGWELYSSGGNQITVTNNGNVDVDVSYKFIRFEGSYMEDLGIDDVTGAFTDENEQPTARSRWLMPPRERL